MSASDELPQSDPDRDRGLVGQPSTTEELAGMGLLGPPIVRDRATEIERARLRAAAFVRAARSANTLRTYRSAFGIYEAWCRRLGFESLSGDPDQIGMYVAGLTEQRLKLSTIRLRLSAIAAAHREAGLSLDLKHPQIARVMDGIARTIGSRSTPVAPVLAAEMVAMMHALPATSLGIRDRALLLIGFGAALRRSELVALDLTDVVVAEAGLKILIRASKGDQEGRGQEVGIHRSAEPLLCPVRALRAWLEVRGRDAGPLFQRIIRGGGVRPERLSDKGVARVVKAAVARIGLDPDQYAGHSLRAGLATSASNAGADLLHIMNQTRHRSVETARRYVRDREIWNNNVSLLVLPQDASPAKPRPGGRDP